MFTDSYLYAFDDLNKVISYRRIEAEYMNVRTVKFVIAQMLNWGFGIKDIYLVGDRRGLGKEFLAAQKSRDFTEHFAFKDTCQREGIIVFHEE